MYWSYDTTRIWIICPIFLSNIQDENKEKPSLIMLLNTRVYCVLEIWLFKDMVTWSSFLKKEIKTKRKKNYLSCSLITRFIVHWSYDISKTWLIGPIFSEKNQDQNEEKLSLIMLLITRVYCVLELLHIKYMVNWSHFLRYKSGSKGRKTISHHVTLY